MSKTTIGLSPRRKSWMIFGGIVWLFIGNVIAVLVIRLQGGTSIDVIAIYLIFGALGLLPIFRAVFSQIAFDQDKIIYTQPLFKIVCHWDDFVGLRVSAEGVSLRFLDSRIITFRFIARALKFLGIWNNTIPLSPYLTLENRGKVWAVIERYLADEHEKKVLELLLTG